MKPPVPLPFKPLLELVNQITVGLLPAAIRRQYGFSWDPARHLALLGGAEYIKRVLAAAAAGEAADDPAGRGLAAAQEVDVVKPAVCAAFATPGRCVAAEARRNQSVR